MAEDMPITWFVGNLDDEECSPECVKYVDQGYDLVSVRITNEDFQNKVLDHVDAYRASLPHDFDVTSDTIPLIPLLTPEYTELTPETCMPFMLAQVSPWLDLASPDPLISHVSRQVLNQEIAYASFCGFQNILIPGPGHEHNQLRIANVPQYARAIAHALTLSPYCQLHIALPLIPPHAVDVSDKSLAHRHRAKVRAKAAEHNEELSVWDAWNTTRAICGHSPRLYISLVFSDELPSPTLQSRYYAEPVRSVQFPASAFAISGRGPVLPPFTVDLLHHFMHLKQPPWLLLSDTGSSYTRSDQVVSDMSPLNAPTPSEAARLPIHPFTSQAKNLHLKYMRQLQHNQGPRSMVDTFAPGYQDLLQSPLQPLADNLESMTYEVFEKDPIKYEWYERAIALALKDRYEALQRPIVVAVVGAGRGPLVTRVLKASASSNVPVQAHAVEKNQNAYVVLLHRNAHHELWNKSVTVTKSDMRSWKGPFSPTGEIGKVDILVSELLGSFADNELSPECLDGVQHVLHPEHGISIPQSYTAHVSPVAYPVAHANLLHQPVSDSKWSLPYVILLDQVDYLCCRSLDAGSRSGSDLPKPQIQQAWEFKHPVPQSVLDQSLRRRGGHVAGAGNTGGDGWNEHNARSCELRFTATARGVCHGLAGYFETVLYSSPNNPEKQSQRIVELSTNPNTMDDKSKDMISWFPIFFPLKTPLSIPDGAEIRVSMFRQTDDRKVWYEWMVEVFVEINGLAQRCGASELHSSYKDGCLV